MTFAWKKDNEVLNDAEIHNQAHLRVQGGVGGETEVTEYTTTLQLRNVEYSSKGNYQCVISNHFGSSYSNKARLTVNSKFEMGIKHVCEVHKMPGEFKLKVFFLISSATHLQKDADGPEYSSWCNSQTGVCGSG